ncbi:hypothetical protein MBAV_001649 [Candidatus Magnetobacterium bavaricum]|uniref:Uncharacterized protein n=1 Tax=Candidatus Magnetobacterium bavaricum TaxID=29290 RepID=A0A0F3GZM3_9BACT|nr:hypothetical protein MBAV_001649 [Candidatus Magnetobacterium bavaricum]
MNHATYKQGNMSTKKKDTRKNGKIVFKLYKVIRHFFPEIFDKLLKIKDYRKNLEYSLLAFSLRIADVSYISPHILYLSVLL